MSPYSTVDSVATSQLDNGALLVSQSCRWKFARVFGGAFMCHLAVTEDVPGRFMEVSLHEKGFIREFEGSWTVTEEPGRGVIEKKHSTDVESPHAPPSSVCMSMIHPQGMSSSDVGRWVIENKHSTEIESPPPTPSVYVSIHPEGKTSSNVGRVLLINDPPARWGRAVAAHSGATAGADTAVRAQDLPEADRGDLRGRDERG
jgi:hypothetical protein